MMYEITLVLLPVNLNMCHCIKMACQYSDSSFRHVGIPYPDIMVQSAGDENVITIAVCET